MALGYHLCFRLLNDAVIAATQEQQRVVARVFLDQGRAAGLLAFSQADNHLHSENASDRAAAGRFAQAVELGLYWRLAPEVGFAPVYIKPILDARHLYATFRYVLRQPERHALGLDWPREASNLPDLLGLRDLGAYTRANVRRTLPRVHRDELLELLGVPELEPRDGPLDRLVAATLAATALPSLGGRAPEVVGARRAAIEIAAGRVPAPTLASWLEIGDRALRKLRTQAPDPELVLCIRRQLHLIEQRSAAALPAEAAFLERAGRRSA
jgi:hypothetical protein